jgi:hypothetical protein
MIRNAATSLACVLVMMSLLAAMPLSTNAQELVGVINIPGNDSDLSKTTEKFEQGTPHNQLGGFSAIDYSAEQKLFFVAPDRGPDDGAVKYQCRIQLIRMERGGEDLNQPWSYEVVKTTMLTDSQGRPFVGLSRQFESDQQFSHRFDPEGIRVLADGRFIISDEYGPYLVVFSPEGKEVKRFKIPAHYQIKNPGIGKDDENAQNKVGRQTNRGMEGLAITADGKYLYGLMQSPLLQDSKLSQKGKPTGLNCRLIRFDMQSGETTEYVYVLDNEDNKLNEILAISDSEFLVIERDGEAGDDAKYKKIVKIDISEATPIDGTESLPEKGLAQGVQPVAKTMLIDLLDPKYKLAGKQMPEKIEGITFGPKMDDGRSLLFISSDNDFSAENPTQIYIFALDQKVSN